MKKKTMTNSGHHARVAERPHAAARRRIVAHGTHGEVAHARQVAHFVAETQCKFCKLN